MRTIIEVLSWLLWAHCKVVRELWFETFVVTLIFMCSVLQLNADILRGNSRPWIKMSWSLLFAWVVIMNMMSFIYGIKSASFSSPLPAILHFFTR